MNHARAIIATLLCLPLALPAFGGCVGGQLTPAGEQLLLTGARLACPFEAAIPAVGSEVVLACPAELAGLQSELDAHTAKAAPSLAPIAPVTTAPTVLLRKGGAGEEVLVHVGWLKAGTPLATADQLRRLALALPPPAGSTAADAGAEGGR